MAAISGKLPFSALTAQAQANAAPAFDMSGYMSAIQASNWQTNQFNAEQAAINRDWQEYMSNTSHQREMRDLEAAGLNPILAARQGASTPSGGQASGSDASGAIAGLLGQMISSQSAQAVADRNNAAARLLEELRHAHNIEIKEKFPDSVTQLVNSFLSGFGFDASDAGQTARKAVKEAVAESKADAKKYENSWPWYVKWFGTLDDYKFWK